MTNPPGSPFLSAGRDPLLPDVIAAARGIEFTGSSGDSNVDAMLFGRRWDGPITYSFPRKASDYTGYSPWNGEQTEFSPVSAMMVEAVRATMTGGSSHPNVLGAMSVTALTQLSVTLRSGGEGDVRIGQSGLMKDAGTYYPSSTQLGGDVWFDNAQYANPRLGNYAYHTAIHELGHSLGLKHPHDRLPLLDPTYDSVEYTVMSYRSYAGGPTGKYRYGAWDAPQTFMMLDIAALQTLYGADYGTRSGATTYRWNPETGQMSIDGVAQGMPGGNRIFMTVWDGGGRDVYDLSNYSTALSVDLAPGAASRFSEAQLANLGNGHRASGNVYNAMLHEGDTRSLIEDARGGSGHDTIRGNQAANTLWGNAGNDVLEGREGNDTLIGGEGFDTALLRGRFLAEGAEGRLESRVTSWEAGGLTVTTFRLTSGGGEAVDSDRLVGIERLRFTDGAIVLDGTALLDPFDYARGNQDVFRAGLDAHSHYDQFGWREGRDPSEHFSTRGYLSAHADVRAAGINPLDHYQADGWREGRDPHAGFDLRLYRLYNPDVAAAEIDPLTHYAQFGQAEGRRIGAAIGDDIRQGFDATYYLLSNPDVGMAGLSAEAHYRQFGWREGRDSSAWFDTEGYLAAYADVRAAGIDPLAHYMADGWREGRDPSAGFDSSAYLAAYADVAAAGVNPLQHFLTSGIYEGRSPFGDGVIG